MNFHRENWRLTEGVFNKLFINSNVKGIMGIYLSNEREITHEIVNSGMALYLET